MAEAVHRLGSHTFTQGLTEAQVARLSGMASPVEFSEDEVILEDGLRSRAFYLVVAGSVSIELRAGRIQVAVQALGEGEAFGWSSLLDHQDTLFRVRARERTTALCIDAAALRAACKEDAVFGAAILERALSMAAARVRATEERFAEMCGVKM